MSIRTSIIIRTLNEREALGRLLGVLRYQESLEGRETIVVDNESTDGTPQLAEESGARVVSIPREEFTYPFSMNIGAELAQGEILIYLVGHALPFRPDWLSSGLEHFADPRVAGVYSPVIPQKGCKWAETFFYWPGYLQAKWRGPHKVTKGGMGVFGATNCALRRSLWEEHPFDERYELGGEDGEWANWVMSQGYHLMCDYRFSVRHSHGLGLEH